MKTLTMCAIAALLTTGCVTGMGLQAAYGAAALNGQPIPVYEAPLSAGLYDVTIRKISTNIYQDVTSRRVIYTRLCLEIAVAEPGVLRLVGAGENALVFTETRQTCEVIGLR